MHGAVTWTGRSWRTPAVAICVKEPRTFTGNIVTDEEMLLSEGIDISGYPRIP